MQAEALFPQGCALVLGASGGIGNGVAEVLAADGADLALVYNRKAEPVTALAQRVATKASCHQCDITDAASLQKLIGDVIAQHGRIHSLIWAAGPLVEQTLLSETSEAAWRRAFEVEVHGLFAVVQALLPHMRENGGGAIVHLGSAGHRRWPARDGLSVAPKAANESFLRGIAVEEGRFGIRANSILVGVIDAGMFRELMAQGQFPEGWVEETHKALALKHWGRAEDIGYAASFLASSRAAYVTGQQISVSGGFGL